MNGARASDPARRARLKGISAKDQAALTLDAWKKTVDVQQHFNDIELRIRNLAITLLAAAIAALGVANAGGMGGSGQQAGAATLRVPLLWGVFALIGAFWVMDRWWYHRLLKAAVAEGGRLEKSLTEQGITVNLGGAISAGSPIIVRDHRISSDNKIDGFYLILATVVLCGIVFLMPTGWYVPLVLLSALWVLWVYAVVQSSRCRAHPPR